MAPRTYDRFELKQSLGANPFDDLSLKLDGEDILLTPVRTNDLLGITRRKRVSLSLTKLQIATAQTISDIERLEQLGSFEADKINKVVEQGDYFVGVPEADSLVEANTAVAALERLIVDEKQQISGIVVSGLGSVGLIEPTYARILYVATEHEAPAEFSEHTYTPHIS